MKRHIFIVMLGLEIAALAIGGILALIDLFRGNTIMLVYLIVIGFAGWISVTYLLTLADMQRDIDSLAIQRNKEAALTDQRLAALEKKVERLEYEVAVLKTERPGAVPDAQPAEKKTSAD